MKLKNIISLCCILNAGIIPNHVIAECSDGCAYCEFFHSCYHCKDRYYWYSTHGGQNSYCNTCQSNCVSCTSDTQCTTCDIGYRIEWLGNRNYCRRCQRGFYGKNCLESCTQHCINGECTMRECTLGCKSMYYKDNDGVCKQCSHRCKTCSSRFSCNSCKPGMYGYLCQAYCFNQCKDGTCDINLGVCTKDCSPGQYQSKKGQCLKCSGRCKTCARYRDTCTSCRSGYLSYGKNCYKCNTGCKKCNWQNGCISCQQGYYLSGHNCVQCPERCATCDSSYACTSCRPGYHISSGQCYACQNCLHQQCFGNGNCKNGCVSQDRFGRKCDNTCKGTIPHCSKCSATNTVATCEICLPGYYPRANQCAPCPVHCANQQCDTNGYCNNGCVTADRFGSRCEKNCSTTIPHCLECITTNTPVTCDICQIGYYLTENLNSCTECSGNCRGGEDCYNGKGACPNGCKDGWTGDKCNEKCQANCKECNHSRPDACNICNNGFHGISCEYACSDKCGNSSDEQICYKENGTCSQGCIDRYWGQQCDKTCNDGCGGLKCLQKDGTCIDECRPNRHGPMCNKTCGSGCFNVQNESNTCDRWNGSCLFGCANGFDGPLCDKSNISGNSIELEGNTSNNSTVIGGALGGAVAMAILIGVVLFFVIRKRRPFCKNSGSTTARVLNASDQACVYARPETPNRRGNASIDTGTSASNPVCTTVSLSGLRDIESTSDMDTTEIDIEEEDETDCVFTCVRETSPHTDTYYNIGGMERSRVPVDQLQAYVDQRATADFEKEFQRLPSGLSRPYQAAMQNRENNRYKMIYPYDASRVVLRSGNSDYINASHIDCYSQYKSYIASQGPTTKTMGDFECFWTMIWQEKVEVIVMLTNLIENGGMKCEMYWPEVTKSQAYDDVTVTCDSEDMYAEYTVRSFSVKKADDQRTLYHVHYTAWPDKGVPDDVTGLLEFRQRVIRCPGTLGGPTVVHCSAGVGRTGTYIALDILTREGRATGHVDVFGCVTALRGQRVSMVQTAEQYKYLHDALMHSLTFHCDPIVASRIREILAENNGATFQTQYQHLNQSTYNISDKEKKAVEANKAETSKNRQGADVPGNKHRLKLSVLRKPGSSNYINAVYINSFKQRDRYIVAQTPLNETVVDFLSLVMQTNCSCVVSLDFENSSDTDVGVYFTPPDKVEKFGIFEVSCKTRDTTPQYVLRQLDIIARGQQDLQQWSVPHVQCTVWGQNSSVPSSAMAFLQLIIDVDRISAESGHSGPIIVHCLTGAERSGLFCVVSNLVQRIATEHQVSVVNTVRQVTARRRNAMPDQDQYRFCYQCLTDYLYSFDTYSNFSL